MTKVSRVLIADDNRMFLNELAQVICRAPDLCVEDIANCEQELFQKIRNNDFDLLIIDLSLTGQTGLGLIAQVKNIRPKLPVLILSMNDEECFLQQAFKYGAAGYLIKGSSSQTVVEAARNIARGKSSVSSPLNVAPIDSRCPDPSGPLHERLSEREIQVMRMIAGGISIKNIAEELMVGTRLVNTLRAAILHKMEMNTTAELTNYAIRRKLI